MDYTKINIQKIENYLKTHLEERRYEHSIGTMECAEFLAKRFNLDIKKASIAGLLHDCAKCFSNEELLSIIKLELKDANADDLVNYKTLHAPVGAYIAEKEFGIEDKEILSAIKYHTVGNLGMSQFEKIIFLADKIEEKTREKSFRDKILKVLDEANGLNKALLMCFDYTIKKLIDKKIRISHVTIDVYNELLSDINT